MVPQTYRLPTGTAVLVVGHPGHELRLHRWLELRRPRVHVLTDGSGPDRPGRLEQTTAVLAGAGATPGAIYGRFTDRAVYAALLAGDARAFCALVDELADDLHNADCVVADAAEGYNPTHDLCRMIVDAAVRRLGRRVPSYEFSLAPDAAPRSPAVALELDDDAFDRKLAAARGYRGLEAEVAEIAQRGLDVLACEVLSVAAPAPEFAEPPFYEAFGAARVAEGRYAETIRYRPHVARVAAALGRCAEAA